MTYDQFAGIFRALVNAEPEHAHTMASEIVEAVGKSVGAQLTPLVDQLLSSAEQIKKERARLAKRGAELEQLEKRLMEQALLSEVGKDRGLG